MTDVPSNLIPVKITGLPEYDGFDTSGFFPYVVGGVSYKVQFSQLAGVGDVPSSRRVDAGTGLTGGGDLSANRTIAIANGGVGTSQLESLAVSPGIYGSATHAPTVTVDIKGRVTNISEVQITPDGYVPEARAIIADIGLSGGGSLTNDVLLSVDFSDDIPQPLGTPVAGVLELAARGDHVHAAVNLSDTNQTQGVLPLGRGGTGDGLSPISGAVVYCDNNSFNMTGTGTPGQVLTSGGTGAPIWLTVSGTGTVQSVDGSGGTTGLTLTGGPITGVGTLTLGGTLAIANGGTGSTSASAARTALDVPQRNGTGASGTWSIGVSGNAGTVTDGVYTTGSYANPSWITSLAGSKITGNITGNAANVTGTVALANGGTGGTDATTARSNLGLGSLATLSTINNSNWSGTALAVANGGTGATTAANARVALLPAYAGNALKVLQINAGATDVAWVTAGSGTVTSIDVSGGATGLSTSGGPVTASGTITLAGTLNVANGGTGLTSYATGDILYASGTTTVAKLADVATGSALISGGIGVAPSYGKIGLTTHVSGTLPVANGGTGGTDAATARSNLGLVIGTNVQAYNDSLQAISGLSPVADRFIYFTGTTTAALGTITTFGRSLVDDADATAGRSTLGLGSLATLNSVNNSNWSGTALSVANGGSGATTLTGVLIGNGTSAFTAVTAPSGAIVGTTDSQTLTNKTLTAPVISSISNTGTITLPTATTTLVGRDTTDTLTNKRVTPRPNMTTTTASPWAWNSDSYDGQGFTALANNLTISADAGTPTDFQRAILRITAATSDRTITFTGATSKGFIDVTNGAMTVSGSDWTYICPVGKVVLFGLIYNANTSRWEISAVTKAP